MDEPAEMELKIGNRGGSRLLDLKANSLYGRQLLIGQIHDETAV